MSQECADSGDCGKQKEEYPEQVEWPVYEEAKGG